MAIFAYFQYIKHAYVGEEDLTSLKMSYVIYEWSQSIYKRMGNKTDRNIN